MQCLRLSWRICLTVFFIILLQRRLARIINLSYDNQLINIQKFASRETQISSRATRVASLERKIMSRETRIASHETRVAPRETRVASRETRVASRETRILSRDTRYATVKLPLSGTVYVSVCVCVFFGGRSGRKRGRGGVFWLILSWKQHISNCTCKEWQDDREMDSLP